MFYGDVPLRPPVLDCTFGQNFLPIMAKKYFALPLFFLSWQSTKLQNGFGVKLVLFSCRQIISQMNFHDRFCKRFVDRKKTFFEKIERLQWSWRNWRKKKLIDLLPLNPARIRMFTIIYLFVPVLDCFFSKKFSANKWIVQLSKFWFIKEPSWSILQKICVPKEKIFW